MMTGETMADNPRRIQVYETPEVTVTFDPNLCRHTGVCMRGLPAVFDIREKRLGAAGEGAVGRCYRAGRALSVRGAADS